MRKCGIILLLCFITLCVHAQRITAEQYIEQFKEIAISEMKRMGVPAAITLAQGLLETENGNSELVKKSNNHFGIKCKNTWTGASVTHDDDLAGECFRAYQTPEESFRDHSNFLRGNTRYGPLFKLDPADYKGWAYGLKRAGYATNPAYPQILIKNIEQYNLQQYTLRAMSNLPDFDPAKYNDSVKSLPSTETTAGTDSSSSGSTPDELLKILTVNTCRCVQARKGISLMVIATKQHISIDRLLEYNEIGKDGILAEDQLIYLQKKSKTGETDLYKVQEGDTWFGVAQKQGMQLQYLLDYNHGKKEDALVAGTMLALKPGVKLPVISAEIPVKDKIHIVAAKEGLYMIAKKYNITIQQLKEWNKLTGDDLKIGQKLIISQ